MYDPSIGRWLTPDPKGFDAGDDNLYRYVRNDPTNATDPTGLDEWPLRLKKRNEPPVPPPVPGIDPDEWRRRVLQSRDWTAAANRMRDERENNAVQKFLGYQPYGLATPEELALRDKAARVLDWQNWKLEDGSLVPIGKLAAGLPPQLIQLGKDLKAEYNQIGGGPRRTMISGLLKSLDQVREAYVSDGKNGPILRAMADSAAEEQRQASLRSAYEKRLSQDAGLRAQLAKAMEEFVLQQRSAFEAKIEDRPAAEQEKLKQQVPWLYGDARKANDPAFKYIAPQVQFTATGNPYIGFAPTAALRRLQLEQSLAMGLYRVLDDEGPFYSRLGSRYGGAPLTVEESKAWLASAQIGSKSAHNFVKDHGPLRPGVRSDDLPIQLVASFMVAGPLGPMALSMSAGRMALSMGLDLALNVSLGAATEYATKRYGAGGGLGTSALMIMGTLLTRKAINSPRLKAVLKTVWKENAPASGSAQAAESVGRVAAQPRTALQVFEELRPGQSLSDLSPHPIPGSARATVSTRSGSASGGVPYTEFRYRWTDAEGIQYTARFHDPTGNSPAGAAASWVIERRIPGTGVGAGPARHPHTEFYLGDGIWVSGNTWHEARQAYTAGTATPTQLNILRRGHHPVR